jgi:hypothetical protein
VWNNSESFYVVLDLDHLELQNRKWKCLEGHEEAQPKG